MSRDRTTGRRALLAGIAGTLTGAAGCASIAGLSRGQTVSVLAAGSLNNALENGLRRRVEPALRIEAHGSARAARFVAAGQKEPDIVSVADTALFEEPLSPAWVAEFATNSIVLAYNPDTDGGQRLADAGAEAWFRPILDGAVAIGRTDPDLDPLGYRALFLLDLATDYYGVETDLRTAIPARAQLYPETQLLSQFETGSIDAAIAYRNMAVERGYDYVDLPGEIDLSDPAHADRYESASYELPSGTVVRGGVISYGSTIRHSSPAVTDVFDAHTSGRYLEEFGFVVPEDYPRFTDNAPNELTN